MIESCWEAMKTKQYCFGLLLQLRDGLAPWPVRQLEGQCPNENLGGGGQRLPMRGGGRLSIFGMLQTEMRYVFFYILFKGILHLHGHARPLQTPAVDRFSW